MDQLTRIATALERIADALEKQNEPFQINSDTVIGPGRVDIKDASEWHHMRYHPHYDQWFDAQKPYDTEIKCESIMMDRELTKEEASALGRAIKRSTIKVHDGKIEKD